MTSKVPGAEPKPTRAPRIKAALSIKLADIDVSDRIQPLDEAKAQEIASSVMLHDRLFQPLGIRQTPNSEKGWRLVFGRHRLRALEILGIVELVEGTHFVRLPMGPQEAELVEIEENLARTHYTPFARAVLLAGYRKACDAEGLFEGKGGDRKSAEYLDRQKAASAKIQAGFTTHAMEVFDLSSDQVERLLRIGGELTRPVGLADRLHFSKIARNQSQLLKLAALPEEQLTRAAEAFDAAQGDFYNLMAILSQAPAAQAKALGKLKAGAAIKDVVGEEPEKAPAFNHWQQAVSSFSQLDFKGRVSATVEHFRHDEKAVRAAVESLGYRLVRVSE